MKKLIVACFVTVCFMLTSLVPSVVLARGEWCASSTKSCPVKAKKTTKVKKHIKHKVSKAKCSCPSKSAKGPKSKKMAVKKSAVKHRKTMKKAASSNPFCGKKECKINKTQGVKNVKPMPSKTTK